MPELPASRPARSKRRISRRTLKRALLCALLFPPLGFVALTVFLDQWGWQERAQPADVIIVLGAKVREGGMASQSLRGRALQAAELYKKGLGRSVICTGGIGDNAPSEAEVAANIVEKAGVEAATTTTLDSRGGICPVQYSTIYREESSHSTWENAVNAAEICHSNGYKRVIIVSDPYHLWRARRYFQKQGLTVYTSPSRGAWLTDYPARRWQLAAREACAVLRDLVIGPR